MITNTTTEPIYTDTEVSRIIYTLQTIYALDDAIANQMQLRRPESFVSPLQQLRLSYANDLKNLTDKSASAESQKPDA